MEREIKRSIEVLREGGLLLYPTDTVWGIGCDADNTEAVKRIYQLKQREESKSMICLVSDQHMLEKHIETIPESVLDILDQADKPTTIIYSKPRDVAKNLVSEDNTLAIRIVRDEFCNALIERYGKPIVSTSANLSGQPTPLTYEEIPDDILKGVDYVVNLHRQKYNVKASKILKIGQSGRIEVIRP